ncbi:hypothetical protein E4U11_001250 [Claviceps purpurea]|nr:hypothetical protein E4U11_001250 [Claviceps purpurea]
MPRSCSDYFRTQSIVFFVDGPMRAFANLWSRSIRRPVVFFTRSSQHVVFAVNRLAVPIPFFVVFVFVIPELLSPMLFDRHHRLRRPRPAVRHRRSLMPSSYSCLKLGLAAFTNDILILTNGNMMPKLSVYSVSVVISASRGPLYKVFSGGSTLRSGAVTLLRVG